MSSTTFPTSFPAAVVKLFELAKHNILPEELECLTTLRNSAGMLCDLETYLIPTISTAHLSAQELALLHHNRSLHPGVWVSMRADCGSMLCFDQPAQLVEPLKEAGYFGVSALAEFAMERGIDYIRLDRDANVVDGLPTFEH